MAHNETRNGLNEDERVPRTWSRSTVADGRWMQNNTLNKYRNSDWFLASAIDSLLDKDDELTQAIADEAQARLDYDGILSARCDFLYTSASKLREDLTTEISDRQDGDAATLRDAKDYASAYANNASAYALSEAKTYAKDYTDTASSYLDGRIDGVSSTFNSYSSNMNTWKTGIDDWKTGINNWQTGINNWKNTTDTNIGNLQSQIDAFENATDVADVVSTSASLNGYNKRLTPGAVIKVLSAGPGNDQQFYYRNKLEKTSAGPFSIENFDVLGSVQPYYSKSETYTQAQTQSLIEDKMRYKVDASSAQDYFTTDQKWQARQNIGASDGKIQWRQPGTGQTLKYTSADLLITYKVFGDTYYRLRADDGTTSKDWVLVPEPAAGQYNYLLTVSPDGDVGWKAPSAELPPVTRPADVGKALVVGSEGLSWDDRGNGYYFVNLKNTNANTFTAVKAAASAHKTIIGYEEEYDSQYRKAYKYFTFAGEYWDQYAFFDSNTNEIQEKRRLWSAGNVSAYNHRFLYTSEQNLQTGEQVQVRKNIDAAQTPLVIWMRYETQTLTDAEMRDIARAVDNSSDYYSPLIYIAFAESTTTRYYRLSLYRGNDSYIFSSTDDKDVSYIQVIISSKEATLHRQLRFWKANYLPDFSSNQETYYVI